MVYRGISLNFYSIPELSRLLATLRLLIYREHSRVPRVRFAEILEPADILLYKAIIRIARIRWSSRRENCLVHIIQL